MKNNPLQLKYLNLAVVVYSSFILATILAYFLINTPHISPLQDTNQEIPVNNGNAGLSNHTISHLLDFAESLVGTTPFLTINGKHYHSDCSGFVLATYQSVGMDLLEYKEEIEYEAQENLVQVLYKISQNKNWLHYEIPLPGDLVFFNNTYDKNNNGIADDPLTHIGLVQSINADETIFFYHLLNPDNGVLLSRLNRIHPMDPEKNDALSQNPDNQLAGDLFCCFARVDG